MSTRILHNTTNQRPLSALRCSVTYCSLNTQGQCSMPHAVLIGSDMRCSLGQEMIIKAEQTERLKKGEK